MKVVCPKCGWAGSDKNCVVLNTWEMILPESLRMREAVDVNCCPECETPVEVYRSNALTFKYFIQSPESFEDSKLSVWHKQGIFPSIVGVYEVASYIGEPLNRRLFAYWFGDCWSIASPDPKDALNNPSKWSGNWAWRGLKQKP